MPDCLLVEADFSAIEAVQVGWFSGDPDYIRLAKLGVHAYLASHIIKKPAKLTWSDADLGAYFKELKGQHKEAYKQAKQTVHLTNYVGTPRKMVELFPETFPRLRDAEALQELYFHLCPKLKPWQESVMQRAAKQNFVGGGDHPFHYKHWFWEVYTYRNKKWSLGPDARRAVAFYPQSTAAGIIKEAALRLTKPGPFYIGDLWKGKTPIRALVHDSILFELPKEKLDYAVDKVVKSMMLPIIAQPNPVEWNLGSHLTIGVEVKAGENWQDMDTYKVGDGVAYDTPVREQEEEEDEDPYAGVEL